MKYVLVQAAFRLPDDYNLKKADLNAALEAMVIYRMVRNKTCKSPKGKPRKLKEWPTIKELFQQFWEDAGKSDRKLCAHVGFGEVADPPKTPAKKARTR